MTVSEVIRANVRDLILDSAKHLTAAGSPMFTRTAIVAALARGVRPAVLVEELSALCRAEQLFEVRPSAGRRPALYSLTRPTLSEGDAPDFGTIGYPSQGTQIGPAWRAMWSCMADGEWHDAFDLAGVGAEAGGCLPATARALLYQAVKAGHVEADSRFDEERSRWRSWYRRTSAASEAA